jgi:diguanylate cyclase (GGDEF)-like protein
MPSEHSNNAPSGTALPAVRWLSAAVGSAAQVKATPQRLAHACRRLLPRGGTLPPKEWEQRHRALLVFLWLNTAAFAISGFVTGRYGIFHSSLHVAALVAFSSVATMRRFRQPIRAASVSLGLLTAAALLVHVTHGLIEAHFYFFVVVVVLTLYEDWRPFLLAVAYVLLHHGVMGMLEPKEVFNRPQEWQDPWAWAAIHAAFIAAAGVAAVIAWRLNENVRERMRATQAMLADAAMIDSLTELPNRRQLMADLERLADGGYSEPILLAMLDLDGFKVYNDTFGHHAGDALLARLGQRLAHAVSATECGRAYRLGGDEFCLLVPAATANPSACINRAASALSERGEGFEVGCSSGSVALPEEATEPARALQLADKRMYIQKDGGRRSAAAQVSDVLLRTLEARNPDLVAHLNVVADLSEAVSVELGLSADEVAEVRQAAELHDVGKMAIPDEILLKVAPLDEDEWKFMYAHTVIGERILSGVPTLGRVALLVRSSHERIDGLGYPDGLAGDAIPFGARIIFGCDAFHAMTSSRPYAPIPSTENEALAELRRCAGAQFDQGVVDALVAVVTRRASFVELPA